MPQSADHLYKARNNASFAAELDPNCDTKTGWALVALFYSALHYVESLCAEAGVHHEDHGEITDHIFSTPDLRPISRDYRELSTLGWNARYKPVRYGAKELEDAKHSHEAIKTRIERLLPKALMEPVAPARPMAQPSAIAAKYAPDQPKPFPDKPRST